MLITLAVLAASDPSSGGGGNINIGNLLAPILSTGIVGVVLIMLIFEIGFITKRSAERERDVMTESHKSEVNAKDQVIEGLRADLQELKQANGQLQMLTQDKMIPALVQATEVSRAYVAELARRNG